MANIAFLNVGYTAAVVYTVGSITYHAINRLEAPYLNEIQIEQRAQASFRAALQNQTDFRSKIKKVYHFITEKLLSCPIVRIVIFLALSFFPNRSSNQPLVLDLNQPLNPNQPLVLGSNQPPNLDDLWEREEFDQLTTCLEDQMSSKGITWAPKIFLKKAPPLSSSLIYIPKFCLDLTLLAERGELRPFFGREKEFRAIGEILGRNQKSNPLLLGPPGVGKTSMAEGIAQKIIRNGNDLHRYFKGKRIFLLQWDRLVMGAEKYSQDKVEHRLLSILKEAKENKENVIIFIDEIHAFLKNSADNIFTDILKPALAEGSFYCIAATTTWDYDKLIEKDPSLERRFPKVNICEPLYEEMQRVLHAVIPRLEAHHSVRISDEAITECITLSQRYLKSYSSFPDKAIDLLDQAASRLSSTAKPYEDPKTMQLSIFLKLLLQMQNQATDPACLNQKIQETRKKFSAVMTKDMVCRLVAERVNLPLEKLQKSEKELLKNLDALMSQKIIGQKKSIKLLCNGIRRARIKLADPNSPAGVFLLLGPTGVGKTASAQALCEILYGSKEKMLRLDMSEYHSSYTISKLIGTSAGYSGYGKGGILTNWLKKNPNSIVLFDEIEKADEVIHDLLLQLFDGGRITSGEGETVQCLDTTFIMTSNIGAEQILKSYHITAEEEEENAHFYQENDELQEEIDRLLRNEFRAEFIGRIQETTIFYPLSKKEIRQIAELQCKTLKEQVGGNLECPNIEVSWDDSLIQFLVEKGYSPKKGARELAGCIRRNMRDPLADLIIQEKIRSGNKIHFTSDGKAVRFMIESAQDKLASQS